MQMIASYYGIDRPRRFFDFLMGFTYGAGDLPGFGYMPVGTDPEIGFLEAASYLGLKRYYCTTNDPILYLKSIRFQLGQNNPVRLPLDMGALYGSDDPIPHSEVLIGYDETNFEYYEPVCSPPATCQPAIHEPGEQGCFVTEERLLEAVDSQSRFFYYPWHYALSIFEPGPRAEDMQSVWQRNGRNLAGGQRMGMRWGASATEYLASQFEKPRPDLDFEKLQNSLKMGTFMRRENAVFLREIAENDSGLLRAAELFEQSACFFQNGSDCLSRGVTTPEEARLIASWLREIAAAEREAGQIFLSSTKNLIL